jgi:hypothetical protein
LQLFDKVFELHCCQEAPRSHQHLSRS